MSFSINDIILLNEKQKELDIKYEACTNCSS